MNYNDEFKLLVIWFIASFILSFLLPDGVAYTVSIILFALYIYIIISSHINK